MSKHSKKQHVRLLALAALGSSALFPAAQVMADPVIVPPITGVVAADKEAGLNVEESSGNINYTLPESANIKARFVDAAIKVGTTGYFNINGTKTLSVDAASRDKIVGIALGAGSNTTVNVNDASSDNYMGILDVNVNSKAKATGIRIGDESPTQATAMTSAYINANISMHNPGFEDDSGVRGPINGGVSGYAGGRWAPTGLLVTANSKSTVTLNGNVDMFIAGTGIATDPLYASSEDSKGKSEVTLNINDGSVTIAVPDKKEAYHSIANYGGTINVNMKYGDPGSQAVKIKGNIATFKQSKKYGGNGFFLSGITNLALATPDSYWEGLVDNAGADTVGEINLYLQNGATWTHRAYGKHGAYAKDMPSDSKSKYDYYDYNSSDAANKGSQLAKLVGGSDANSAGNVIQKDNKTITIANYKGVVRFIYPRTPDTEGTEASNYTGSPVNIKKAEAGSEVIVATDKLNSMSKENVEAAYRALASKIFYADVKAKPDNLKGSLEILEGITTPAKRIAVGAFTFDKQTTGGVYKANSFKAVEASEQEPPKTPGETDTHGDDGKPSDSGNPEETGTHTDGGSPDTKVSGDGGSPSSEVSGGGGQPSSEVSGGGGNPSSDVSGGGNKPGTEISGGGGDSHPEETNKDEPGNKGPEDPSDKGKVEPGNKGPEDPGDKGKVEPGSKGPEEPGDKGKVEPGSKGPEEPGDKGKVEPGSKGPEEPGDKGEVKPSGEGKDQPSGEPSGKPSGEPSGKPSGEPSGKPSGEPSEVNNEDHGNPPKSGEPSEVHSEDHGTPSSGGPSDTHSEDQGTPPGDSPSGVHNGDQGNPPSGGPSSVHNEDQNNPPNGDNPSDNQDSHPNNNQDGNPSSNQDGSPSSNQDGNPSSNQNGSPSSNQDGSPSSNQNGGPSDNQNGGPSDNQNSSPSDNQNGGPSGNQNGGPSGNQNGSPSGVVSPAPNAGNNNAGTVNAVPVAPVSTIVRSAQALTTNLALSWQSEQNDVHKRLGDLRTVPSDTGVWARIYGGEFENKKVEANSNTTFKAIQIGADKKISNDWYIGLAGSYLSADTTPKGLSANSGHITGLTAYGTKLNADGSYVDLVGKYGRLSADFTLTNGMETLKGKAKTNAYSFSAEYGQRLEQGNGYYLEPQVELNWGNVDGNSFTAYNTKAGHPNMTVEQEDIPSLIGRLSVAYGRKSDQGDIFARLSLYHQFAGSFTTKYQATGEEAVALKQDYSQTWLTLSLGASHAINSTTYVYGNFEKGFGGDVRLNWRGDAGLRFTF